MGFLGTAPATGSRYRSSVPDGCGLAFKCPGCRRKPVKAFIFEAIRDIYAGGERSGFLSFARWGAGGIIIVIVILLAIIGILLIGDLAPLSVFSAAVLVILLIVFVLVKRSERIVLPSGSV